jgi:acyl-CoA reductase-like NAD-dependent aldehyde dehydrogenase
MPRAASMSAGSTCSSPTTVFVSTGRNDARTRAMIAVVVPNPSRKASKMITP